MSTTTKRSPGAFLAVGSTGDLTTERLNGSRSMASSYLVTTCPPESPCRVDPRPGRVGADYPGPAPQLAGPTTFTNPGNSGWTFTGTVTPHRYVIFWPDGVVKVGSSLCDDRQRVRQLLRTGGTLLHLAHYSLEDHARAESWLQHACGERWPSAFACRHEATAHLGSQGGGWTECYRVPDDELNDLLELAEA